MIQDINDYLQAAQKQIQEYQKTMADRGIDNRKRAEEQNKKYGYSTIPDEEWFVFGSPIFIMMHGCPWEEKKYHKENEYPHNHDFFEMSYVYRGAFHNTIEGYTIKQPENTLVLLSPQAKHCCDTVNHQDIVFNFLIKRELIENIFLQMFSESEPVCRFFLDSLYNVRQQKPYLFFECDNVLISLIHSMIEEYFGQQEFYQSIIKSKLTELFSRLSRMHKQQNRELGETDSYQLMVQIETYLEQNYSTATLSSMAKFFHYTPSYLSKLIQQQFQKKFSTLLQEIRLQYACRYLGYSSLPIDQVVELVGYTDVSHFYRVFKQKYGVSPNQYRKQNNTLKKAKNNIKNPLK